MNKTELVQAVADAAELTKASAQRALEAVLEAITQALAAGESVVIPGFGTFAVGERAARTGRNPQTGAALEIAASTVVKFKAGKALKDAVNEEAVVG
jgi:DNA-binding protein HU-beta